MVLLQKWLSFQLFFLANVGQENIFYGILERKNAFLGYKNKKFRKISKKEKFSKGFSPRFLSKNRNFYTRTLNSQKLDIFPKGLTHAFAPKMAIILTFF